MMKRFQNLGCRVVEVPVHHYHRYHGSSQFFRFKHLRRVFIQLFTAWWKLVARPTLSGLSNFAEVRVEIRNAGNQR
jgi:hypothetical protein